MWKKSEKFLYVIEKLLHPLRMVRNWGFLAEGRGWGEERRGKGEKKQCGPPIWTHGYAAGDYSLAYSTSWGRADTRRICGIDF
jgi:hypothetical protein